MSSSQFLFPEWGRSPNFFETEKVTIFSPKTVIFHVNHRKWWKYCWKNRWYFWWLLEIVKFLSQLLSPFLVTILSPNMVTIFSPEMVAFQVNHRKRWKKWWKKRWCLRWMLEISQILSPFLVTILPQNTTFMWSWTEMTSECLKIQRLQSRNSQLCKSRQV